MFNNEDLLMPGTSEAGMASQSQLADLQKALLAPGSADDMYGTTQTAGGVLTMQSLEGMLVDLTLNVKDFTLWQDVNKIKAFSTVEEYDQQIGMGRSDGGFVDQMENSEFVDPDFRKQIAQVKFMSEAWKVADVQEAVNSIINVRTRQQRAAMTRLLRNCNTAMYDGNSTMIPKSFDGLAKTINSSSTDQVKDMRGTSVTMTTFNVLGQLITEANGHVENAKAYFSPAGIQNLSTIIEAQSATSGDRKIVEMGKNGITIGGKISEIMTAYGPITPRMDKLLGLAYESKQVPQYYNTSSSTWVEGASSAKAPSMPSFTLTNQAGPTAGSQWALATVRPSNVKYFYRVVARNEYGRSVAAAAIETTNVVATGGSIDIVITPNPADAGDKLPTCFEIYSTKVSGSGVYRYMASIAAATNPLAVVTYSDLNTYIPGTARIFIVDQTTSGEDRVMGFKQLLPVHNTDLAKMGRYSQGLINLYGTPIYYKPTVLCEIRNVGIDQTNTNLFNTI